MSTFDPAAIHLVMFDMAGTTVSDAAGGGSRVVEALRASFAEAGVSVDADDLARHRGRDKRSAVRELLRLKRPGTPPRDEEVNAIVARLLSRLEAQVADMREMPGTTRVLELLRHHGVHAGLGSGFPPELVESIVARFGWREAGLVAYVASAETLGAGRPDPRMILDAMAKLGITEARQVLKVGDTVLDIEEGRNAGAWTAVVRSGTQPDAMLRAAMPDFMLDGVADLPALFGWSSLEPGPAGAG